MAASHVVFAPEQAAVVIRHAASERPNEACGVLVGRSDDEAVRIVRAVPTRNVWLPEAERTRRYTLDPREQIAVERAARDEGLEVVGYYHSHPTGGPTPSGTDVEMAWPGYVYLIVGFDGDAAALGAWTMDDAGRRMIQLESDRAG